MRELQIVTSTGHGGLEWLLARFALLPKTTNGSSKPLSSIQSTRAFTTASSACRLLPPVKLSPALRDQTAERRDLLPPHRQKASLVLRLQASAAPVPAVTTTLTSPLASKVACRLNDLLKFSLRAA